MHLEVLLVTLFALLVDDELDVEGTKTLVLQLVFNHSHTEGITTSIKSPAHYCYQFDV